MEYTGKYKEYFLKTSKTTSHCTICGKDLPITDFYISNKLYIDSRCKSCTSNYHREWRKTHRDIDRRLAREYYRNNKEKSLRASRKRKYHLTDGQLDNLPTKCEICGSTTRLCIDHDHKTGKVRGVLCSYCNTALGVAKDNPEYFQHFIDYLNKHRDKND